MPTLPILPWLSLKEVDPGVLELTWGDEEQPAGTARLSDWVTLRQQCKKTQRRCEAAGWTFLESGIAAEIRRFEAEHARALASAWTAIEALLPAAFARGSFAAVRSGGLLELPVGSLVVSSRPSRATDGTLPFDSHPALKLTGPEFARSLSRAPLPAADQLTLLIAEDLGQGAYLSRRTPHGQSLQIGHEGLAETLAFFECQQRVLQAAGTVGVRVVHGFTVEEFALEVFEPPRPFLMVAAHLEPSTDETEAGVACRDGLVRLSALHAVSTAARAERGPSALLAVDLLLCNAADQLAACFHAAGVEVTNSACSLIPSGKLLVLLLRMFERRLLDGTRSFQHAWLASSLGA